MRYLYRYVYDIKLFIIYKIISELNNMDSQSLRQKSTERNNGKASSNSSSNKSKNMNSYIGFERQELKTYELKELLELKHIVGNYIKKTTQKIKNYEYFILYKRILIELKLRNASSEDSKKEVDTQCGNFGDEINQEKEKVQAEKEKKNDFLKRKRHSSSSIFDFEIPNFLNDKEIQSIKRENELKLKSESDDAKSTSSICSGYNAKKNLKYFKGNFYTY